MHGILGSIWPKMAVPFLRKVKDETLLVNCLYCVGFLDLFAVSCLLPLLTHRARELGASPAVVGLIGSIYGGLQFFSSPIMGKLSDNFGRKNILLLSLCGASMSYFLTALPTTLLFLALCRVPAGIFKHSQSVAKTYLADISSPVDRSKVFGNFNAISNLGFVVGPLIGGHLAMTSNGFSKVAMLTGSIFMVNFFFVWFCVKPVEDSKGQSYPTESLRSRQEVASDGSGETLNNTNAEMLNQLIHKKVDQEEVEEKVNTEAKSNPHTTVPCEASRASVLDMLVIRFVMGFSMLVFRSNFMSLLEFNFNTNPKTNGYIMSYNGLVSGLSGLLIGSIGNFYSHSDSKMLLHFSCILTFSILGITFSPNVFFVTAFIFPLAVSSSVCRVCVTNIMFSRSREDQKGLVLGVGNSLLAFARMISPALGGILQEFSAFAPGCTGAMIAAVGVLMIIILSPSDRNELRKKRD
ncbi:major facilitator superfamily domain-containing protein 9-like [Montipora foliosa]|uniref:major facilitator superfamily domain-containing protein 9-like n=1 Tax=Montipora foliosa TaxID=591990 RepID=UPI0035F1D15E